MNPMRKYILKKEKALRLKRWGRLEFSKYNLKALLLQTTIQKSATKHKKKQSKTTSGAGNIV